MDATVETARFFADCDVIDISFNNGTSMEVYVAVSAEQRSRGLANISSLDLDGMLFYYQRPSYVPFTAEKMLMDIDVAWYDRAGTLLQQMTAEAGMGAMYCPKAFSYVLEAPVGSIPASDLKLETKW
jgi:uncharacterized membrane protein (UPF0127 family)